MRLDDRWQSILCHEAAIPATPFIRFLSMEGRDAVGFPNQLHVLPEQGSQSEGRPGTSTSLVFAALPRTFSTYPTIDRLISIGFSCFLGRSVGRSIHPFPCTREKREPGGVR